MGRKKPNFWIYSNKPLFPDASLMDKKKWTTFSHMSVKNHRYFIHFWINNFFPIKNWSHFVFFDQKLITSPVSTIQKWTAIQQKKKKKWTQIEFHKKIKIKNLYMKINAASEGDIGMKCTMAHNLTLPRYHLLQPSN